MTRTRERELAAVPGPLALAALLTLLVAGGALVAVGVPRGALAQPRAAPVASGSVLLSLGLWLVGGGFFLVLPNEAKVITFLGRYLGTVRRAGWYWTWPVPVALRRRVSLRVRNFESEDLKVNDQSGNPIEISAVIVWRVVDTAQASFDVEDYEQFVKIQTETGIRHVASQYPYDAYEPGVRSLRENLDEVSQSLQAEIQQHLTQAGVEVLDTRLRRIAYSPEIAADMLRRQQADAVVAARRRIVEGAVGMVEDALGRLEQANVVSLDAERKAAMVSNLLVVLTGEHPVQPVINVGTIYH